MVDSRTNRRLAAVLAADVVGYSRMMGADEAGTLAALKRHRETIFDPAVAANGGRIVKLMGDGVLVEFGSVVDAVNCAVAVQQAIAADATAKITLRVGINLGDVIIDGDDIYGDGVNVAARLEPLAEPGGICVASIVNDSIGSRIDVAFQDGGEVQVKNIDRPIRIWKWHPSHSGSSPATRAPASPGALPSLAILPFQNLSGDPEQEYFADGVVEDLTTALSRFRSFTVAARNSAFVYKGRPVDVRQVARELGVQYVLEGSVRRAGNRLRVAAQLIDGATGSHLWARNFDGELAEIFDMQDRITESAVGVIAPHIQQAEIARSRRERPESLAAYDLYLRGQAKLETLHPEESAAGIALLEQATTLDPRYPLALATAAWAFEHRIHMGWPSLTENDEQRCLDLARRALALAGDDAAILAPCGLILQLVGYEYEQGLRTVMRAVELNPHVSGVMFFAGMANMKGGSVDEAETSFQRALRINPADGPSMMGLAYVDLCRGDHAGAIDWARRSLVVNPNFGASHWMLISAYAHSGQIDEARRALAAYRAIHPNADLARIVKGQHSCDPTRQRVIEDGLRMAGMT